MCIIPGASFDVHDPFLRQKMTPESTKIHSINVITTTTTTTSALTILALQLRDTNDDCTIWQ
jgi:hypothetical protein